ncbi:MAG: DNA-processing protein DprA [Candidatus Margulisbacteria bacterium]|nr:DNA-processing protein DprA [Candidatus Margulisiibacteriota bacterium]MBU1021127.1 DNA-processing protein DprA [Candidatus Margulisiibacteriota bacterium]MBU1728682.1 DNA-processing protein DprA [Candidatus Margulisiibacteriota bacterium]MBU1955133.1 DNA-processing protein DprA [Candidatus Margulisiibacteriota bacterium]
MRDEFKYLLALSSVPGIGNATLKALLTHFELAEDICTATEKELLSVPGINPKIVAEIIKARETHNFDIQLKIDMPSHTEIIEYTNEKYPQLLKTIYDPPPYLFARGNLDLLDELCFGVVGTRKATSYGLKMAQHISTGLAQAGFTIVSGMAEGVDAEAHRAALAVTGKTIAVLGCGVDIVYPSINQSLYKEIYKHGLIISEFLPASEPTKYTFPKRNRIISGLSKGVLFVEGGKKSGAMITVDYALEQGRDVFAIPGRIDTDAAQGTNWLIQHGAKLVQNANDISEEYGMVCDAHNVCSVNRVKAIIKNYQLDQESERILEALAEGEQNIEILSRLLDMDIRSLQAKLTMLELKGIVKRVSGRVFGLA